MPRGSAHSELVIPDRNLAILSGEDTIRIIQDATRSPDPSVRLILMLSRPVARARAGATLLAAASIFAARTRL